MPLPAAAKAAASVQDLEASPALRVIGNEKDTLQGRTLGILIADGSDAALIKPIQAAAKAAGATVKLVAPRVASVKLEDGSEVKADGQLQGTPSVIFDAVAVVLSAQATSQLLKEAAAVQWVMDAFGHLKAIASNPDAKPLLDKAGVTPDEGVIALEPEKLLAAAKRRYFEREPTVRMLA